MPVWLILIVGLLLFLRGRRRQHGHRPRFLRIRLIWELVAPAAATTRTGTLKFPYTIHIDIDIQSRTSFLTLDSCLSVSCHDSPMVSSIIVEMVVVEMIDEIVTGLGLLYKVASQRFCAFRPWSPKLKAPDASPPLALPLLKLWSTDSALKPIYVCLKGQLIFLSWDAQYAVAQYSARIITLITALQASHVRFCDTFSIRCL